MKTRCKMILDRKENDDDEVLLDFRAVADGSPENESFFAATPAGVLSLQVVNKSAVEGLEPGKSYYIDILDPETTDPAQDDFELARQFGSLPEMTEFARKLRDLLSAMGEGSRERGMRCFNTLVKHSGKSEPNYEACLADINRILSESDARDID